MGTDISDKGVKTLRGMKFPKVKLVLGGNYPVPVRLDHTKITREGFWQLAQAPPPWLHIRDDDGHLWGSLRDRGRTVWPKQLAGGKSEREKTLFRLLLLGCSLDANEEGAVVEASLTLTSPMSRDLCYRTKEQTREVFDLLAKLGTVERLKIYQLCEEHPAPLDDEETAAIANLRQLRNLEMSGCCLTEAGWLHLAGLTQLRKLNLQYAKISGEPVRKLHKAMPNCKIIGRPIFDDKGDKGK